MVRLLMKLGSLLVEKLLIPSITIRTRGRYRLLILDGHDSNLTPKFDKVCAGHDIIPVCMPPHSSPLLQPVDIGYFAGFIRAYSSILDQKMSQGISHIDKLDFISAPASVY